MRFNKQLIINGVLAVACSLPLSAMGNQPQNLGILKQQLIKYHDSGEYAAELQAVSQQALSYLRKRVEANANAAHPSKLAVVFDIDETTLSNYPAMKKMNFGGSFENIMRAQSAGNDKAIPSVKVIYDYAKKHKVAVFFVTGRSTKYGETTTKNLKKAGYDHYTALIMKPDDYNKTSVVPYKSSARKNITTMGYDIALNIGDQQSDLQGKYAERSFKLPNPYYYIP